MRAQRSQTRSKRVRRLRERPDDGLREIAPHDEDLEVTSKLTSAWAYLLLLVLIILVLAVLQPNQLGGLQFWLEVVVAVVSVAAAFYRTERRREQRARIMDLLTREGPLAPEEIAVNVGALDGSKFRKLLMSMRQRGLISRTADGYIVA